MQPFETTCNHLQPFAQAAANGCKWLQMAAWASGCKWLQVAAGGCRHVPS